MVRHGLDRDEILRRVRFLRPSWSLRSQFGYQNVMYLAAGQAVAKVTGKSWDDVVQERIFAPLGMTTNTTTRPLAELPNVASPHPEIDDTLRVIPWHNIDNIAPAGSINSNGARHGAVGAPPAQPGQVRRQAAHQHRRDRRDARAAHGTALQRRQQGDQPILAPRIPTGSAGSSRTIAAESCASTAATSTA